MLIIWSCALLTHSVIARHLAHSTRKGKRFLFFGKPEQSRFK